MACAQRPAALLIHIAAVTAETSTAPVTSHSHVENSVPLLAITRIGSATCQLGDVGLSVAYKSLRKLWHYTMV